MCEGSWTIPLGTDLYRKTVGVVGLGRIGRGVVKRLTGFEATVLVHTPRRDEDLARTDGFEYVGLPEILARSDYLTLHAPLTPDTRFLIREESIAQMKPTAFVINTARGGLVEDRDLLAALTGKRLAGAGLDVFMSESDATYKDVTRQLVALPNVIAQPHAGASTREGLDRTNMVAAQCVVAILNGTTVPPECVVADGRAERPESKVRYPSNADRSNTDRP
jgi:D-3-phosphoglycerate dehydrogenase